jgi:hypothetical protein
MSVTKKISGNYTVIPTGQMNIDTSLVVINGNLVVTGNSQSIVSTDSAITDHTITLNNGLGSNAPNPLGANIIVDRGSSANVSIAWNETCKSWQLTDNGTTYGNIVVAAPSGNINITNTTLFTNSGSGNVQISANTAGSGGSGVYVTNTQTTNAELVTKAKAVAYSIVFG